MLPTQPKNQRLAATLLLLALIIIPNSGCTTGLRAKNQSKLSELTDKSQRYSSVIAQTTPQEIIQNTEMRSLPGKLDSVPMFNSNSPEWVKTEGILLSTFPPDNKSVSAAHLNFPFQGRFDLFAHHFTHTPPNLQTLYLGLIIHNPTNQTITVDVLQAASYLMEPDAPFKQKPPMIENTNGEVYSGPGIRAVDTVLRGIRQSNFPPKLVIPAGQSRMLMNLPIPVKDLEKPINGRSTYMRLNSSGKIYVASLAMYAKKNPNGTDRAPNLSEWQQLLNTGGLAGPRDKTPTPPEQIGGQLIYGRVAGVQEGSQWQAQLVDNTNTKTLTIPQPNKAFSYPISTLRGGRMGTNQSQAARMLVRYPDTAYESHGNYGVHYDLSLPLINPTDQPQTVTLTLETPIKEDQLSQQGLRFRQPPLDFPYFRGTVRLRYINDQSQSLTRYLHLWQRRGQLVEPLVQVQLAPGEKRLIQLDFLYPPDSTPPQVLTVKTVE
ncbi:MAG TPA: hypothetical protein DD379_18190 [Cyanobacteria bacterium UBA11162]|nr:hypothetical protein [Cyanobacteria bacterium UBA11162]